MVKSIDFRDIITIILIILTVLFALKLSQEKRTAQNNIFYQVVGKIESDSDYCLSDEEIQAIWNAKITDEYKNYLFEADMRKRQFVQDGNSPKINYINCN